MARSRSPLAIHPPPGRPTAWIAASGDGAAPVANRLPQHPTALSATATLMAAMLAALLLLLPLPFAPAPAMAADSSVVEHLRVKVAAADVEAWLEAERGSWEPWLAQQPGFLRRQLLWDPAREEGTLLIHWASRRQWQAIPSQEVSQVQQRFESLARQATGTAQGNPFPLVYEGELQPL